MKILFRLMLKDTLSDKISLFYAVLFPLGLMLGISLFIDAPKHSSLLTAIIGISLLFWNLQGLAFQIFRQKSKGVYRLIKIAPMKMTEFIATMILARTFVSLVINLFIMMIGFFMLNIPFSFLQIFLWTLIMITSSLCFSTIGFFISNIAKNEGQINAYSNIMYLPMVFCTEAFYSLQNAPGFIDVIGKCLPFHYIVQGLRYSLVDEVGTVLFSLLVICLFTTFFFLLTILTHTSRKKFSIYNRKVVSQK